MKRFVSLTMTAAAAMFAGQASAAEDSFLVFDWAEREDGAEEAHAAPSGWPIRESTDPVTVGAYAAFLNAKAADDPYGLYDERMGTEDIGLVRFGNKGSFTYAVMKGRHENTIRYVSFEDAVRFSNWLHNGQGDGDTESGAYEFDEYGTAQLRTQARYFVIEEPQLFDNGGFVNGDTSAEPSRDGPSSKSPDDRSAGTFGDADTTDEDNASEIDAASGLQGSSVSRPENLMPSFRIASVEPSGDYNLDRRQDVFDLVGFLGAFEDGNATADMDEDGTVGVFDLIRFLSMFSAAAAS